MSYVTNPHDSQNETPDEGAKSLRTKFVARQPIFDRLQRVYGYELLFRSGLDNFCDISNANYASLSVIADSLLFHIIENLTETHKAFINVDRQALLGDYSFLFPKELAVVEILESVELDADALAAIRRLKGAGYVVALDDVTSCERIQSVLDLVNIAKVDLRLSTPRQRRDLIQMLGSSRVLSLAEKVETPEEFRETASMGFDYFQGFFFAKPQIISRRDIPAFKLNYLRMLHAVNRPEMDMDEVEAIIKTEEAFCYKLLRYLNSPFFGFRSSIHSIRHGLCLLGEGEVRRWVSLLALTEMGMDKPAELVSTSLRRASFCELLAPATGMAGREGNLFLLGLLSLIDAVLDRPRSQIVSELPIHEEIKAALLDGSTRLAAVLRLVEAYEKADWETVTKLAATLRLDERTIPEVYLQSVTRARQVMRLS